MCDMEGTCKWWHSNAFETHDFDLVEATVLGNTVRVAQESNCSGFSSWYTEPCGDRNWGSNKVGALY